MAGLAHNDTYNFDYETLVYLNTYTTERYSANYVAVKVDVTLNTTIYDSKSTATSSATLEDWFLDKINNDDYIQDIVLLNNSNGDTSICQSVNASASEVEYLDSSNKLMWNGTITFLVTQTEVNQDLSYFLSVENITGVNTTSSTNNTNLKQSSPQQILSSYVQSTTVTHTVSFNGNRGTTNVNSVTVTEGVTYQLANLVTATRDGYTLDSWNTAADGSGTRYTLTGNNQFTSDVYLFAQWTAATTTDFIKLYAYWQDQETTDTRDWNNHETANHYIGAISAGSYKLVFYLKEAATRDGGWNLSDAYDEQIMGAGNFTANGFNQAGWHEYDVTLEDNEPDVYLTTKTDAPYFAYIYNTITNSIVWASHKEQLRDSFIRVEYEKNEITFPHKHWIPFYVETQTNSFSVSKAQTYGSDVIYTTVNQNKYLLFRGLMGIDTLTITSGESELILPVTITGTCGCHVVLDAHRYDYSNKDNSEIFTIFRKDNNAVTHAIILHTGNGPSTKDTTANRVKIEVLAGDTSHITYQSENLVEGTENMYTTSCSFYYESGVAYNDVIVKVTPWRNGIYDESSAWTFNIQNDAIDSTVIDEQIQRGTYQVDGDIVAATGAGIAGLLTPAQLSGQEYELLDGGTMNITLKQALTIRKVVEDTWHYSGLQTSTYNGTITGLEFTYPSDIFSVTGDIDSEGVVENTANNSISITEISNTASEGVVTFTILGTYSDGTEINKSQSTTILLAEVPKKWYMIHDTQLPELPENWAFTSQPTLGNEPTRVLLTAQYGETENTRSIYVFYVPEVDTIVINSEGWNGDYDADPIILSLNRTTNLFTLLNLPATAETVNDSPFEVEVTAANYAGTIKLRLHRSIE